jgi:outer membrane protein assembly factor BamD (BamD/ComL family)
LLLLPGCGSDRPKEETFVRDVAAGEGPGPGDLLEKAQTARVAEKKLALFEQIVATYPDSPQADDAQFMIGFVLHENLGRKDDAKAVFDVLLEKYPDSDWIDDAQKLMSMSDSMPASP